MTPEGDSLLWMFRIISSIYGALYNLGLHPPGGDLHAAWRSAAPSCRIDDITGIRPRASVAEFAVFGCFFLTYTKGFW